MAKIPVCHFADKEEIGPRKYSLNILAYPKYYKDGNELKLTDTTIVASKDPGWNWEVKKGVFKLRIKNDGSFEVNHLEDIYVQKLTGIGFFNSDTKERVVKSGFTLSNPTVSGREISWSLPLGCTYKIEYISNQLKDVLVISQQAKKYLNNNKPDGWTTQNTWMGLIYDMDLSQSSMIESKDFEKDDDILFLKDGRIKHKIKKDVVKHSNYSLDPEVDNTGRIWVKKKFYRNGKYVEAIPIVALDSEDGNIIFNTTVTFQEGVAGYSGFIDSSLNGYNAANRDTNYGSDTENYFQGYYFQCHYIIKFDVSSLASTADISSAMLYLDCTTGNDGASRMCWIYRVFKPWTESGVTWNDWITPNSEWTTGGCGSASDAGVDNSGDGTGSDRKATFEDSYSWPPGSQNDFDFNITTAVQSWVEGSWANNGLIVISNTAQSGGDRGFYNKFFYSSENATEANRPYVTIIYTDVAYPLYSREAIALPAGIVDLATLFSAQEYTDVAADDDVYVDIRASANNGVFLFKSDLKYKNIAVITWIGKSNVAGSTSEIFLQAYNRTTATWTTLTSNDSVAAGTEFTLTSTITGLTDYIDTTGELVCRVYQAVV